MTRPQEVADNEIIAAGNRLKAPGSRISGDRLRGADGNRGNIDRLERVWAKHVAECGEPAACDVAPDRQMSPKLKAMAAEFLATIACAWNSAWAGIYCEIDAEISDGNRIRGELLEAARVQYQEDHSEAMAALATADQQMELLHQAIEEKENQLHASALERARLEERLSADRDRASSESARAASAIAELTSKVTSTVVECERQRRESVALAAENRVLREEQVKLGKMVDLLSEETFSVRNQLDVALREVGSESSLRRQAEERLVNARDAENESIRCAAALRKDLTFCASKFLHALKVLGSEKLEFLRVLLDPETAEGRALGQILRDNARVCEANADLLWSEDGGWLTTESTSVECAEKERKRSVARVRRRIARGGQAEFMGPISEGGRP